MSDDDSPKGGKDGEPGAGTGHGLIWRLAVSFGLLAVLGARWNLMDWLTPFLVLPLLGLMWALYAVALGWELVRLIRAGFARRTLPGFAAVLVCGGLAVFTPFTDLWLQWDFDLHEAAREHVVRMVRGGELTPNLSHNPRLIALPPGSPGVSMGGNEIVVEEHDGGTYVFFFTYRGILDNYSGFLYVPPGGDPRLFADLGEERTTRLVRVRGRWVYAAHW